MVGATVIEIEGEAMRGTYAMVLSSSSSPGASLRLTDGDESSPRRVGVGVDPPVLVTPVTDGATFLSLVDPLPFRVSLPSDSLAEVARFAGELTAAGEDVSTGFEVSIFLGGAGGGFFASAAGVAVVVGVDLAVGDAGVAVGLTGGGGNLNALGLAAAAEAVGEVGFGSAFASGFGSGFGSGLVSVLVGAGLGDSGLAAAALALSSAAAAGLGFSGSGFFAGGGGGTVFLTGGGGGATTFLGGSGGGAAGGGASSPESLRFGGASSSESSFRAGLRRGLSSSLSSLFLRPRRGCIHHNTSYHHHS